MSQWLHKTLITTESGLRLCPVCETDGIKESVIYPTNEEPTVSTFYWKAHSDSEGVLHHHNPNKRTRKWRCTRRDHLFALTQYNPCPVCDWTNHDTKLTRIKNDD